MRIKILTFCLTILFIGSAFIFGCYGWFIDKQKKVLLGLSRSTFPYNNYTDNELYFGLSNNINTKTIRTPNRTYKLLRIYVQNKQIVEALTLFSSKYKDEYKKLLETAYQNNNISEFSEKLEENIIKDNLNCYEFRCTYLMEDSGNAIEFVKNKQGEWLIESL